LIHRFKDSMIILGIILALSLTGANGISFSGTTDNEAFQATVNADINDAAAVNYKGSGDLSFVGSGNAKYAKSYKTGTTSSQVGITIKNADAFAGHIGGRKNIKNKATSAYLDVSAQGFDFLKAYGSSIAGSVKSGVDLEVVNGDATFSIGTWANGKSMKTVSSLATGEGNFIQGSEIEASGYFSGCKGELGAYLEEGYLEDYELSLASSKYDGCFAYQSADWALGDHMDFWAETKKTASGITKEMEADIEVIDGAIENYEAYIYDGRSYQLSQVFDYASAANLDTNIYYMQLSKAGKIVVEANSDMDNGIATEYLGMAANPGVLQEFGTVDSEHFWMENSHKEITKRATKNTYSNLHADDVNAEGLFGASGVIGTKRGSEILADRVEADDIEVNNRYEDNLKKDGGYGQVGAEMWGSSDVSALTDYIGIASYNTATGEKEVSAQGHVANQYGHVDSNDSTNGDDSEYFDTDNGFDNYFYGKEVSASPWESTLLVGHQTDVDESIQDAIDLIPADEQDEAYGNIFLLEKTYYENNIVNNNNGYEKSFNLLGASYYLPFAYDNTVIDADTTEDGVGEGRIFGLYSDTANRDFYFENIDFNNGMAVWDAGGAIRIVGDDTWHSDVDVNNCDFTNNHATWGGAIYNTGGDLDISNSNFYSNTAEYAGGAIENDEGRTHIEGGTFQDNSVTITGSGWGGAIMNYEGDLSTEDVNFIDNGAPNGGAVAGFGNAAQYYSQDDVFSGNGASRGGAIYLNAGTVVNVASGTFTGNTASVGGGAVLIDQTGGVATYIDTANTYSGNTPDNIRIIP
jgi:hypothetical protein